MQQQQQTERELRRCSLCTAMALMVPLEQQFQEFWCPHEFCEHHSSNVFIESFKRQEFDSIEYGTPQKHYYQCPLCSQQFGSWLYLSVPMRSPNYYFGPIQQQQFGETYSTASTQPIYEPLHVETNGGGGEGSSSQATTSTNAPPTDTSMPSQ